MHTMTSRPHIVADSTESANTDDEPEPERSLGPWNSGSPVDALQAVVRELSRGGSSCTARVKSHHELGTAEVYRQRLSRSLLVTGTTPMASELRKLINDGAAPGWTLQPLPGTRTPLDALAPHLLRLSGTVRYRNLLARSGFAYVEEIAALSDQCLLDIRNGGPKFIETVRHAIRLLGLEPAPAATVTIDSSAPETQQPPVLEPAVLEALRTAAAWAVTETGADTMEDLIHQALQILDDLRRDHLRRGKVLGIF